MIAILLCIVAAGAGGGVVGAIPGVLKARFGASEVIVTIMLNFIVLALLNYIVAAHIHVPETLHTPEMQAGAMPRLAAVSAMFAGSAANTTFLLAIVAAVGCLVVPVPDATRLRASRRGTAARRGRIRRRSRRRSVGQNHDPERCARRPRWPELRPRLQALLRGRLRYRQRLSGHRGRAGGSKSPTWA